MTDRELMYKIIENQGLILNVLSALMQDKDDSNRVKAIAKGMYLMGKRGDDHDSNA